MLADNETKIDLLNNEAIAATIVELLQKHPERPVTVGVHGDWGAGKSSILEMIETRLSKADDVLCLKFNGWRYQGFEDAKIAFIEGIAHGLLDKRPALRKAADEVKTLFSKIDWLKVAKHAGSLAFTAYTGIPNPEQMRAITAALQGMVDKPAELLSKENAEIALKLFTSATKPGEGSKSAPEEIRQFRKAFDDLLSRAEVKQVVVLIDDLDRCLPDTAVETLEALRLFLFTARTAFVVAADEAMIEYSVRRHFPDLTENAGPRDYARNYLEKLIQVPFRIPPLGETETRVYATLLLIGDELGEEDGDFTKLINAAREVLKKPWENRVLDIEAVRAVLGGKTSRVTDELALAEQVGPTLARGSRGNPREIKRFINTLLLRQHMAAARGFGGEIKRPIMAKLMLAERYIPTLFEQVGLSAVAHSGGHCVELKPLEAEARGGGVERRGNGSTSKKSRVGEASSTPAATAAENPVLQEWLASALVKDWARIEPSLAEVDLRPYLFVAREKKNYFTAASPLGRLGVLVDQLMGPKMAVLGMEAQLRQLPAPEAEQVFEELKGRILGGDKFDAEPAGIAGMSVLVSAQSVLQPKLLGLLEILPAERTGTWVVAGWSKALTDATMKTRFNKLLEGWAKGSSAPALKAAASAALKLQAGRR